MKIYRLPQLADLAPGGEYRLGADDISTDAVYLLYGRLRPKETNRKVTATAGYDEIFCVVKGRMKVRQGKASFTVAAGEAFRLTGPDGVTIENLDAEDSVYINAGGLKGASAGERKKAPEPGLKEAAAEAALPKEAVEEDEFEITREDGPEDDNKEEKET